VAVILNIETATSLCSVALSVNGKVVSQRETFEDKSHASKLTVFIKEILEEKGIGIPDIDAVAVGKGPGSYTGLRIGVSTAKGLCYGASLPLIAVSTLQILFKQVTANPVNLSELFLGKPDALFCPMIDARRMEVFTSVYNTQGEEVESAAAKIIAPDSFHEMLSGHTVIFFGSGMEKCRSILTDPNAVFVPDVNPHAASLALLAEDKYYQQEFEDIAYFEPFYLKDFIATISKKGIPL
jgi:tRNA threonylcarbamoyladenosine biosynthesis protein TsaB